MSYPLLFTPETQRGRNNFDFMRFILAVMVVFTHSYVIVSTDWKNLEPFGVLDRQQMTLGTLAVDFFFVISGFLITQSWDASSGIWSYLKKRLLRIYPAFLGVSIFCALVAGPMGAADPHKYLHAITLKHFIKTFINLKEPVYGPTFLSVPCQWTVDAPIWTIRYEFFCYLGVIVLGVISALRFRWMTIPLFLFAYSLTIRQDFTGWSYNEYQPVKFIGAPDYWPRFGVFFLSGMLFYLYRDKIPRFGWLFALSLVATVASIFTAHDMTLTLPIFGAYALLYIASSQRLKLHQFGSKVDLSYGIYLWAWPTQQMLEVKYQPHFTALTMFAAALSISACVAALSSVLIERPALALKKRKAAIPVFAPAPATPPIASPSVASVNSYDLAETGSDERADAYPVTS